MPHTGKCQVGHSGDHFNQLDEVHSMRMIAYRTKLVRRPTKAFILGMTYVGIQLPAHAGECAAPVISQTTLAEAREMWTSLA